MDNFFFHRGLLPNGSPKVQMWFGRGSDADVVRMWFGVGSDVFSDLVQTVWQKLRESGFQQCWGCTAVYKRAPVRLELIWRSLEKFQGAAGIGATGLRGSEGVSERAPGDVRDLGLENWSQNAPLRGLLEQPLGDSVRHGTLLAFYGGQSGLTLP